MELRQELQKLDYFCKGTVLARRMKCGHPSCACHTDRTKRHGPYWEWTDKANTKTVNVRLNPAAGPLYKSASRQYRRLKSLLSRLEKVSRLSTRRSRRVFHSFSASGLAAAPNLAAGAPAGPAHLQPAPVSRVVSGAWRSGTAPRPIRAASAISARAAPRCLADSEPLAVPE